MPETKREIEDMTDEEVVELVAVATLRWGDCYASEAREFVTPKDGDLVRRRISSILVMDLVAGCSCGCTSRVISKWSR